MKEEHKANNTNHYNSGVAYVHEIRYGEKAHNGPFRRKGSTEDVLALLVEYLEEKETYFETKMEPWKISRVDEIEWKRPVLYFGLIRHPGGLRRQRWAYDLDTDEATLISEGPIPLSKPYKALKDAQAIVEAIVGGVEHPCVTRRGDLFIINPRKIPELMNAPKQTVEGRVKRLKFRIRDLIKSHPEFEETRYRNMLAYRMKGT